jgi:hypothetical protein
MVSSPQKKRREKIKKIDGLNPADWANCLNESAYLLISIHTHKATQNKQKSDPPLLSRQTTFELLTYMYIYFSVISVASCNKTKNPDALTSCELELELIQTQMAQKPMLRAEVYARALRASQNHNTYI